MIDVRPAILQAKKKYPVYYTRDTHWNFYGATNAYLEIADNLSIDYDGIARFKSSDYDIKPSYRPLPGDLYRMVHPEAKDSMKDYDPVLKPGHKPPYLSFIDTLKYATDSLTLQKTVVYTNDSTTSSLKLMVFRDSYTEYLMRNLSYSFKTSYFVWTHRFMPEPVIKTKPDIVMEILVERFMPMYFLDDTLAMKKSIEAAYKLAMPDSLK
jgi:hypothetical protein